jgi:hypothetical protein
MAWNLMATPRTIFMTGVGRTSGMIDINSALPQSAMLLILDWK